MALTANTLYPPIVNTMGAGFIYTQTARVYFGFPNTVSLSDIMNIQLSVVNMYTNANELNRTNHPSGIKICTIQTDNTVSGLMKYYVELLPADLQTGAFTPDKYYSVQMRFTMNGAASVPSNPAQIDAWISANSDYFSEWSTVTLIRPVYQPLLAVRDFLNYSGTAIVLNTDLLSVVGEVVSNSLSKDALDSFKVGLSYAGGAALEETNWERPVATNQLAHSFTQLLATSTSYQLDISYRMKSGYTETKTYLFSVSAQSAISVPSTIEVTPNTDDALVTVTAKVNAAFTGTLNFKRASYIDNFTTWTTLKSAPVDTQSTQTIVFEDLYIESEILYKYAIELVNISGNKTNLNIFPNPILMRFEDIYLVGKNGQQLRLQFNQSISGFKKVKNDGIIPTIGGKYPFVYRNGANDYRQFRLSALLSMLTDENSRFFSPDEVYRGSAPFYNDYKTTERINEYTEVFLEKAFREKAEAFMLNNDVKLLKSATEGNLLIKLTDVSLEPNQTLSRRIADVSASCTEIDSYLIDNLKKYNIIK